MHSKVENDREGTGGFGKKKVRSKEKRKIHYNHMGGEGPERSTKQRTPPFKITRGSKDTKCDPGLKREGKELRERKRQGQVDCSVFDKVRKSQGVVPTGEEKKGKSGRHLGDQKKKRKGDIQEKSRSEPSAKSEEGFLIVWL